MPPNPEIRLLLRFYVTTFSILKQKKQIFFFFRSKSPENLRGFLDPHQIFQENQGFNAFLCGNIFQIFAIFSHFLIKFLKRYRYRGVDLAQKRSKEGELGPNLT